MHLHSHLNCSQLSGSAQLPFFKSINVTGDKYQSYGTVASTPWALKAALGLLSDTVPLFGYHKSSYILLVSIVGTAAFALLGFLQFSQSSAAIAAFLLLLGNLQMAAVDLLCEGKYAEMMVSKPKSGSSLVSYVWGLYMTGTFLGSLVAGPMADHFNPRYIFLVCLPFAAQVLIPIGLGWLPEERLPAGSRGFQSEKIRRHPDLCKLSIVMTMGASAVGLSALLWSGSVQSGVSGIVALVLCVLGVRWLPTMLGRANLYMFLSSMLYVSLPGALDFWFTGNEQCVPGGPNFSMTYYVTYASLVGSVAGGIGVAVFQRFLSTGSFRTAFSVTYILKLAASAFDIAIVKRYNRRIGIPDSVAFMLGDAVIYQVAYTLDFMPAVVLTSKVCPKGMEASVYALLASYQNLGSNVSRALGVALIDALGIKTTVPCDFERLPFAIAIAHLVLPLLVFPLVFVLIPRARMTDDLFEGVDEENNLEFARVPSEEPAEREIAEDELEQEPLNPHPPTATGTIESDAVVASGVWKSTAIPVDDINDDQEIEGYTDGGDIASSERPSLLSFTPQTPVRDTESLRRRGISSDIPSSAVDDDNDISENHEK